MGHRLRRRGWVPGEAEGLVQAIAGATSAATTDELDDQLTELVERNRAIHERECLNLNPAANAMNPRAEAVLASGLGSRPSLGYPGAKYETGLEAIEEIEVVAAELAARVFDAPFAEVRVPSGAIANLYAFLACTGPGDSIIVPPATVGGHVTHHPAGAAGLRGLAVHEAPVDPERYTVDVDGVAALAERVRPSLISIGGSLNLHHHPVAELRAVAEAVGATLLFDAAHLSGPIAGGAWPNPLHEGAHVMTMSTYKSLGGPPAGLLLTTDPEVAERVDAIAFPGLTANFDVAKTAALAVTLLDWIEAGAAYARAMVDAARTLAHELRERGVPATDTSSHAFAVPAAPFDDGDAAARHLRRANLLASGIGHPAGPAVRLGTNEIVRWGIGAEHMATVAGFVADAWADGEPDRLDAVADRVTAFRSEFRRIGYVRGRLPSASP